MAMEPSRQQVSPEQKNDATPPEAQNLPPGETVVFEGNAEPDVHTPEYLEAAGTETEAVPGEDAAQVNTGRASRDAQDE